jgi:hypothetical protein
MIPLPDTAILHIDPATAAAWLAAARARPAGDAREHYDPAMQAELRDAIRAAAPDATARFTAAVETRLAAPPHVALVRGLTWDPAHHLCIALNALFGTIIAGRYRPPRSQIVHHLSVQTELPGAAGQMRGAEVFHSDGATHTHPADLLNMVCVRPDAGGGGRTRVLDTAQIRALVQARGGPDALRWFEQTPLPWRITDPEDGRRYTGGLQAIATFMDWRGVDPRGEGIARRPVFERDTVLWRRDAIEHGFTLLGETPDAETLAMLDLMDQVLAEATDAYDFGLDADDFMISDNRRTLHTRSPLSHDYETSDRLMLRCWVRGQEGSEEAPHHREGGSLRPL